MCLTAWYGHDSKGRISIRLILACVGSVVLVEPSSKSKGGSGPRLEGHAARASTRLSRHPKQNGRDNLRFTHGSRLEI